MNLKKVEDLQTLRPDKQYLIESGYGYGWFVSNLRSVEETRYFDNVKHKQIELVSDVCTVYELP